MNGSTKQPQSICNIPCATAPYVVTIDGRAYAGFLNRMAAEHAVALWMGEIDANGEPVPAAARGNRGWAALRGRRVEIVERDTFVANARHPK